MLSKEASNQGADKRRANRRLGNDEMEAIVRIDSTIMKLRLNTAGDGIIVVEVAAALQLHIFLVKKLS